MNNVSRNKIVTFGEVLMRLSPPDKLKVIQTHQLDLFFGGTEVNVAASLAFFGENTQQITNVSNDMIGDAAIASMRRLGIDVSEVKKVDHPLGLYFLEVGSGMRASKISYNRLNGSFANITPESVPWSKILSDSTFFHWTGISPGISESAYETLKKGLQIAREKKLTITADPAYRSNLWKYGRKSREVLKELVSLSTIFIGGVNEINEILGSGFGSSEEEFIEASKTLISECPSIEKVFDKVRIGVSASNQKIYGRVWTGSEFIKTKKVEISDVVDRIGTGDAYAAGLIYGLIHFDDQKALEFARAACALKHTIVGDVNLANVEEVLEVMSGDSGGRVKR